MNTPSPMNRNRQDLTTLGIFLAIMAVAFFAGTDTIDIQLHDTYFVVNRFIFILPIVGLIMIILFLTRLLKAKFKSIPSMVGISIGAAVIVYSMSVLIAMGKMIF